PDHVELAHKPGDHFTRFARRADRVQNPVCQVAHVPQSSSISSNSRPTASAITAISPNVSLSHSLLFICAYTCCTNFRACSSVSSVPMSLTTYSLQSLAFPAAL